jgi:hypothetical protein
VVVVAAFFEVAATGTTVFDGTEAAPVPLELEAVIVKVYESPLVSPLTTHERGPVVQVQVCPPLLDWVASTAVTLYPVTADPP